MRSVHRFPVPDLVLLMRAPSQWRVVTDAEPPAVSHSNTEHNSIPFLLAHSHLTVNHIPLHIHT